jgi:uncharacterized Fe-S center protein
MKHVRKIMTCLVLSLAPILGVQAQGEGGEETPKVYFTSEISAESLFKVYQALGVNASGRVAVKISTGESSQTNYLRPELIKNLVQSVDGTLVECNTAYNGNRSNSTDHRNAIRERGYMDIADVDIMDEEDTMHIPVADDTHIKYDIVGSHLANYDFMINLAHFKGHAMGGFGGVLKNQSIGVASRNGKAYIHSAGAVTDASQMWGNLAAQDDFLESMAAAAQAVHNYFKNKNGIVYINVMNNLSVDCDCDGSPASPEMKDIGILASTDPVALDQACLDLVFNHSNTSGDDASALVERINSRHGTHTVDYAAQIGLGSKSYELIDITDASDIHHVEADQLRYNVFAINGEKVLTNAKSIENLKPGVYLVNGIKTVIH